MQLSGTFHSICNLLLFRSLSRDFFFFGHESDKTRVLGWNPAWCFLEPFGDQGAIPLAFEEVELLGRGRKLVKIPMLMAKWPFF